MDHRLPGAERLQTGALFALDLEQLQQVGLLARRRHHLQRAASVGEEDPCRRGVEQLDAAPAQGGQHLDDIEVIHEGVGQLQERVSQQGFSDKPCLSDRQGFADRL